MTLSLETIQQMPADDVRRALAEAQGWRNILWNQRNIPQDWFGDRPDGMKHYQVPDYPNDANEWCKLMCQVNAAPRFLLFIYNDVVMLRGTDIYTGTGEADDGLYWKLEHDGTPESIGLAVCRAVLWWMQGEVGK